jgi:histidine triad (HIT) family protein
LASPPDGCLFCQIVQNGVYVAQTKGFVAVKDIHPQAPVHLLVIPERHVDSFREIGEFPARETKHMLEFIAATARAAGLSDYRVQTNVGHGAGQTIFHLHWHILGSPDSTGDASAEMATAVTEL